MNNEILTAIRNLFDACGAQSLSQILYEIKTQCNFHSVNLIVEHLDYLVGLGAIHTELDDDSIQYWGNTSDFY